MKEPVKKIVVGGINKDFDDFFFQNSKIFTSSHVECEIKKKIKTLFARSFLKIKVVPQFRPARSQKNFRIQNFFGEILS